MDSLFRWVIAGVFLMTSPFLAIGAHEAYETSAQLRASQRLPGRVVANRLVVDQRDGQEDQAYQPEVTFQSPDGVSHRFTDPAGSLPPDYQVGAAVTVLCTAARPEQARILSWKRLWLVPTLFVGLGLLPGAITWLLLRRVARA